MAAAIPRARVAQACVGCGDGCGQCGDGVLSMCGGGGIANYRKGRVQYGDFAFYGWLAQGFTINPDDPNDRFNGPLTFNDRSNEYQLNQLYFAFENIVDRCGCDWDLGGRVDLLYGTDYFFTQAAGLETHSDGTPKWNSPNGPRDGGSAALYGSPCRSFMRKCLPRWEMASASNWGTFIRLWATNR